MSRNMSTKSSFGVELKAGWMDMMADSNILTHSVGGVAEKKSPALCFLHNRACIPPQGDPCLPY